MEPDKASKEHHGKATAGLVLGIFSLLSEFLALIPFLLIRNQNLNFSQLMKNPFFQTGAVAIVLLIAIGVIVAILGIVFSGLSLKEFKSMGRTGLVLSIISVLIFVIYVFVMFKYIIILALAS